MMTTVAKINAIHQFPTYTAFILSLAASLVYTNIDINCQEVGISFHTPSGYHLTVIEGGEAVIRCDYHYNGSQDNPHPTNWRMQRQGEEPTLLWPGSFPPNIRYNESAGGLVITDVDTHMNGTTFSCRFVLQTDEGIILLCENIPTLITVELAVVGTTAAETGTYHSTTATSASAALVFRSSQRLTLTQAFSVIFFYLSFVIIKF